ncbi:MAG TPA: DinB family protein [Bryobacteraceae bacterium]|nr:DinB family protein [Bryobacteraceae bacterium]
MNYYGAKELAASFRTVRKNTIKIAEEIPEDKYEFRATPDTRTVAQMLMHIALALEVPEIIHRTEKRTTMEGFDFFSVFGRIQAEEAAARSKQEILQKLGEGGERFAGWLETVPDDFLAERVGMPAGMPGGSKTRFEMLLSVKEHEMHHRAQLMVMERMVGIKPHLTRDMEAMIAEFIKSRAQKA